MPISGLDNVDMEAATQAGVMVVNAPTSNITSAAELAVALLLATPATSPRPPALKGGAWKRSKYTGVELLARWSAWSGSAASARWSPSASAFG